jgi:hypothetical protein
MLRISSENIPSEMIDDAVSILAKNGFNADRNKIPERKPMHIIYDGVYSDAVFADIVKDFAGITDEELRDAADISMYVPYVPEGISYVAGDYRFIFSAEDYLRTIIMQKDYVGTEEIEEIEEEVRENIRLLRESERHKIQDGGVRNAERIIRNFIRTYQNQDVRLGFDIIKFEEDMIGDTEYVWIKQTLDGTPVDSHIAYAEITGGGVKYFSGRWYFGELAVADRSMPLLDSVNILFKCLQSDGYIARGQESLERMEIEYSVIFHDNQEFYLLPSWRLVFGGGTELSYDMITGDRN